VLNYNENEEPGDRAWAETHLLGKVVVTSKLDDTLIALAPSFIEEHLEIDNALDNKLLN